MSAGIHWNLKPSMPPPSGLELWLRDHRFVKLYAPPAGQVIVQTEPEPLWRCSRQTFATSRPTSTRSNEIVGEANGRRGRAGLRRDAGDMGLRRHDAGIGGEGIGDRGVGQGLGGDAAAALGRRCAAIADALGCDRRAARNGERRIGGNAALRRGNRCAAAQRNAGRSGQGGDAGAHAAAELGVAGSPGRHGRMGCQALCRGTASGWWSR